MTAVPTEAPTPLIWYVSYGSNMLAERFDTYIRGGVAPGSMKNNPGCCDSSPALDSRAVILPGGLFYATESRVWGYGGCAFLDSSLPGYTFARAWLVSGEQFEDIVTQECGGNPRTDDPVLQADDLLSGGEVSVGDRLYGRGFIVGSIEGVPAATFTSPLLYEEAREGCSYLGGRRFFLNPPSAAYLAVITQGVAETMLLPGPVML